MLIDFRQFLYDSVEKVQFNTVFFFFFFFLHDRNAKTNTSTQSEYTVQTLANNLNTRDDRKVRFFFSDTAKSTDFK